MISHRTDLQWAYAVAYAGPKDEMIAYLLLGATFGFAAVVQPGPLQAYLISQAASHGWRRTLPAAFSPLLSDGPVIALTVLVLSRVPSWFTQWLRVAGGVFVLYLAFGAFKMWRTWDPKTAAQAPSTGRSLLKATAVNLLNPNPWISWSLVLGPLLLKGWREAPAHGIALLAGFYGVMVLGLASTIALFGMAGKPGSRVSRILIGLSAAALAVFGCYLVWSGAAVPE
jgi:threonine/homoserine/homoserine lactone efflux protein